MGCSAAVAKCSRLFCVNAGFMQQFAAIVDNQRPEQHIGEVLKKLSGGRKPTRILCTGHSLGGALATLGQPCPHPLPRAPLSCSQCIWHMKLHVSRAELAHALLCQQADSGRVSRVCDPCQRLSKGLSEFYNTDPSIFCSDLLQCCQAAVTKAQA